MPAPASTPPQAPGTSRRPRRSRRLFTLALLWLAIGALAFGVGELIMRVRVEGDLGAAWSSFFRGRAASGTSGVEGLLVADDELGYRLNPELEQINAFGIRHAELVTPKPAGTRRLLVLGDSVSWPKDGFVSLLRRSLEEREGADWEVLNAAVQGYTTHQAVRFFRRELQGLEPDLVLLQYCCNDNHRFLHRLTSGGNWLLTEDARRALLPEEGGLLGFLAQRSYLVFELRKQHYLSTQPLSFYPWEGRPEFQPAWEAGSWPAFESELDLLRETCEALGARLAVLAVPYEPQLEARLLEADREYTLTPQRSIAAACEARGLPFLDLHPAFLAHGTGSAGRLYKDGIHLTEEGHELARRELVAFLDRTGLLAGR